MSRATDRRSRAWMPAAVVFLAWLVAAGCGGRGVTLVPVSGIVEVDGEPLATGAITVAPADGRPASGMIGPDGRFTLSTFEPGDGVMPGRHKVVVIASRSLSPSRVQWLVPKSMRTLATTPLELEVTAPTEAARIEISTAGEKPEIVVVNIEGDISDTVD